MPKEQGCTHVPNCIHACARLGLESDDLAALTGYTSKALRALAHLREAWAGGDDNNAGSVVKAICELLHGHSFRDNWRRCASVLIHDLNADAAQKLVTAIRQELEAGADRIGSTLGGGYADEWRDAVLRAAVFSGASLGVG